MTLTTAKLMVLVLLLLVGSACQPIRPEAAIAEECTDEDKINLLRAYEERFRNDDAQGVADLFTEDAVFAFDPSPYMERASGIYKVPFVARADGREGIKAMFDLLNSLDAGVVFDTPRVQEDTVIASGKQTSSMSPDYGTPGTEMAGTQMIVVRNCSIATSRFIISQAALDAMPAEAAEAAARCEDRYKSSLFQRFLNGVWDGNAELAILPWAANAVLRFDGLPRWEEASQAYIVDPETAQQATGLPEIEPLLATMIEQQTGITPHLDVQQIEGLTLTLPVTVTQFNPSPDFSALPLTELGGVYTATFNDQCEVAALDFVYSEETLQRLNEAKTQ
ncbi:MAG: nuclear transport factor 2 family protein [Caldilineaceae bacterium]